MKIATILLLSATLANPFQHGSEKLSCFSAQSDARVMYGVSVVKDDNKDQMNIGICDSVNKCSFSSVFDADMIGKIGWLDDKTVGVELKNSSADGLWGFASIRYTKVNNTEARLITKLHKGIPKLTDAKTFSVKSCAQTPAIGTGKR